MSLVGTSVGEYQVRAVIGRGGMGEVYEGLQPMIGKRVAIKVLLPKAAANEVLVHRFLAEARAVNAIGHRGIVDIFGFGRLPDGRHYLVMELLPGEPVDAYLRRRGPLPVAEVLEVLEELLDALWAAHQAGIVHRDLKPSNLFLVQPPNGRRYLKLLDFGIAKLHGNEGMGLTSPNMVLGTPTYMAPEQVSGSAAPSVDLYAVGVMTFKLLTGRVPFDAENTMMVLEKHLRDPVPPVHLVRPDVPQALEAFVQRMMAKLPMDRPITAAAARDEVQRMRAGLPSNEVYESPTAVNMAPMLVTPLPPPEDTSESRLQTDRGPALHDDAGGNTTVMMQSGSTPVPAMVVERAALSGLSPLPASPLPSPMPAVMLSPSLERGLPPTVPAPAAQVPPPGRPVWVWFLLGVAAVGLGAGVAMLSRALLQAPQVADPIILPDPHVRETPAPPPLPPAGPSRADLEGRIKRLEKRVVGNRAARMMIDEARSDLERAKNDADLHGVDEFLTDFEQKFPEH